MPARGGSTRLPRKNLRDLGGKPLLVWTLEAALNSRYIDRVIVSTDDGEIASVARQFGVDVPFIRPEYLATGHAKSIDVVLHALDNCSCSPKEYVYLVLLQPTSPLRTSTHIDEAVELVFSERLNGAIGVTEIEHPLEWSNTLPYDLSMSDFFDRQAVEKRSQELPKRYRINGAIYICNVQQVIEQKTLFLRSSLKAFVMKSEDSIDIDTEFDLKVAQYLVSLI